MRAAVLLTTLFLLATSAFATTYWTVVSSITSSQSNITQIDPTTGAFKTICSLSTQEYGLTPIYTDTQNNLFITYNKNTQQLIYFTITASPATGSCDQALAPVKQVALPSTITANNAVVLEIFRESSTTILISTQYGSNNYQMSVYRWTLGTSQVTQLFYVDTQQSTDSPNPIGPLAFDAQNDIIYNIQYRGLGSVNFPAAVVYTLDVKNNISRVVDVPLLINWSGGRLMSSIVWNANTHRIIGLWNIGTTADARLISLDPKSGNYGEKYRSASLAYCAEFEPYVTGQTDSVLLSCIDTTATNHYYTSFSLKQMKFNNYPQFYIGGEEYVPDYLIPIN
eukprot:TRINITY_DN1780_c0_g1_i1.p1 TRINITY_DN1780_c0_g1~~TRINITY_DN1780_c0_g1_i1.p1  ORF type:complete len:338 (+),score=76.51 TRINITY_DN1780_c0_g1_i1:83-1096(+)